MRRFQVFCLVATLLAAVLPPVASAAGSGACARLALETYGRVLRADLRFASACALAARSSRDRSRAEEKCAALRSPGRGLDRVATSAQRRLRLRCDGDRWPAWIAPPDCDTLQNGSDRARLDTCLVHAAHCLAARILTATLGTEGIERLDAQHPLNLHFDAAGIAGNRLAACLPPETTTTTTTLDSPPTTTVDGPPTTTLPEDPPDTTTTTLPFESTSTTLADPGDDATTTTTTFPHTSTTTLPDEPDDPPTTTTSTLATATTSTLPPPLPRLVITEIHSNPEALADTAGEYFEIQNVADEEVDLLGLRVRDAGNDSFTVTTSVVVPPGGYAVFGRTAQAALGAVDYVYGSAMTLTNTSDSIVLLLDDEVIDSVTYGPGFPLHAGASTSLRPDHVDPLLNDLASSWCRETRPLGNGDFGSPGLPSSCP